MGAKYPVLFSKMASFFAIFVLKLVTPLRANLVPSLSKIRFILFSNKSPSFCFWDQTILGWLLFHNFFWEKKWINTHWTAKSKETYTRNYAKEKWKIKWEQVFSENSCRRQAKVSNVHFLWTVSVLQIMEKQWKIINYWKKCMHGTSTFFSIYCEFFKMTLGFQELSDSSTPDLRLKPIWQRFLVLKFL